MRTLGFEVVRICGVLKKTLRVENSEVKSLQEVSGQSNSKQGKVGSEGGSGVCMYESSG